MIIIGIIFISLAAILYTSSIFIEKFKIGYLTLWLVAMFGCGFLSDLIGTSQMFLVARVKFTLSLHSFAGYFALFIMGAHLYWAIKAIIKSGNSQKNFTRYSIYAWFVWVAAFISGIPKVSSLILNWLSS